ncbi:Serine/threonine-protein phosphatase 7 long form-like [Vitis vinifera]|uniref:Serine/threonine-protein phosphatase 7 long form-like n=1 Tax=Vitis vinifera TaxID=29760 RepID=A0A438I9S4_VITVI|nr:Serine/threonine-protein phosphatase 7 long form-like [Vitis vinifera]
MLVGEMTSTLQDVAILFGLHVHGHPVTGSTDIDWHALCEELLGVRLSETDIRGASFRVRFITTHFSHLPPGVLDEITSHAPMPIDERFPPDALGSRWRIPLSHIDTPHHVLVTYRDEFDGQ